MLEVVRKMRDERGKVEFEELDLRHIAELTDGVVSLKNGNARELQSTPWATRQLLRALKIPASFYLELDKKVQEPVLAHQRGLHGLEERFKMRIRNGLLTAVVHPDYAQVPIEDVLEQLPAWDVLGSATDTDEPVVNVKLAAPGSVMKMPGDQVHGYELVASEVGACNLRLEALLIEVICSNGMVRSRPEGLPYFNMPMTVYVPEEFVAVASNVSKNLLSEAETCEQRILWAMDQRVKVQEMLDHWMELRYLPTVVPKKVSSRLEETGESELSRFELARIVSNVGSTLRYQTRRHFERTAGNLLGLRVEARVS